MYILDDTIVAISSAAGSAGRGIIRLSGPEALGLADAIFQGDDGMPVIEAASWSVIKGRCRLTKAVFCPADLYIFRAPRSYTTQNVVEFHLPGSGPLLQMVLQELLATGDGVRSAEPGEFTARAFFNGRIDLTEAEAVAEVINAHSDGQLRAAERLLDGRLHRVCSEITRRLTEALALVEAGIDFSEEDIEFATGEQLQGQVTAVLGDLDRLLTNSMTWDELTHLPRVAIAGPANAGKSSLVNSLSGIDRSIVSLIAGATRDLLTVPLSLPDGECMLIDTAGLYDAAEVVSDPLAEAARKLSRRAVATCDLLLWVFDAAEADSYGFSALPDDMELPEHVILIANKIDLPHHEQQLDDILSDASTCSIRVSALRGDNLNLLKVRIDNALRKILTCETSTQAMALTARQHQLLQNGRDCLNGAISLLEDAGRAVPNDPDQVQWELLAVELRSCLDHLGCISGVVITEDVLDNIFSRFCVGK
ncbi:MAG: tRNA modification GTPase [Sedimentisphaerales bacterium]|nr:tRNA modification GTPase [Sedimentisphaerales bacterium]